MNSIGLNKKKDDKGAVQYWRQKIENNPVIFAQTDCKDLSREQYEYQRSRPRPADVRFDKLLVWRQWQNNWRVLQLQATVGCYHWASVTKYIPDLSTHTIDRNGIYTKLFHLSYYYCKIYLVKHNLLNIVAWLVLPKVVNAKRLKYANLYRETFNTRFLF